MSYNIDTVKCLQINACMKASDIAMLLEEHEDMLPEGCFLHDLENAARKHLRSSELQSDLVPLKNLQWYGEGSGSTWGFFRSTVVPLIRGSAQLLLTWEGGDSITGFAIKDGAGAECEVRHVLTLPKDW